MMPPRNRNMASVQRRDGCTTLIVLGSGASLKISFLFHSSFFNGIFFHLGGHTTEMMRIMKGLSSKYQPRIYVVAETDQISLNKVQKFETESGSSLTKWSAKVVPRSREVNQNLFMSVFQSMRAVSASIPIIFGTMPDLVRKMPYSRRVCHTFSFRITAF